MRTAASASAGGIGTEPGKSLARRPDVHGTFGPAPRSRSTPSDSTHLSQHWLWHAFGSAHATHTLHPRVVRHASQHSAGPDFFIMMNRNGFGASHTVWGSMADDESMELALKLVQGKSNSKPGTMRMLSEEISFTASPAEAKSA